MVNICLRRSNQSPAHHYIDNYICVPTYLVGPIATQATRVVNSAAASCGSLQLPMGMSFIFGDAPRCYLLPQLIFQRLGYTSEAHSARRGPLGTPTEF